MTKYYRLSIYYFCAFCVLFASCNRKATKVVVAPANTSTTPTQEVPTDVPVKADPSKVYVMYHIERTPCYGNCPVFEADIYSDRNVVYKGMRGVDKIGIYNAKISPEGLRQIQENLEQVKYFEFAERYPIDEKNKIEDLPSTITSVNNGKISRKIVNNYDSPANLQWFEHQLETVIMQLDLTKADENK